MEILVEKKHITALHKRIKDQGHLKLLFQSRVTVMHTHWDNTKSKSSIQITKKRAQNCLLIFISV